MNRTSIVALVIGAMLFGCGVGMVAHEAMEPEEAIAYEGQKWEYHRVKKPVAFSDKQTHEAIVEWLDGLGEDGWEPVLKEAGNAHYYWFKRPLN